MTSGFTINCDDCAMQGTATCDDCIVTFLCDRQPLRPVLVDAEEARAVRSLQRAGLAPDLRHVPRRCAG